MKTGAPPAAATRTLTNERGWNIFVRSKPRYGPLEHEQWHKDETDPTGSMCLCSIRHLTIGQENTVVAVQLQQRQKSALAHAETLVRVHIMHSCVFVERLSGVAEKWAASVRLTFLPTSGKKKYTYSVFLCILILVVTEKQHLGQQ